MKRIQRLTFLFICFCFFPLLAMDDDEKRDLATAKKTMSKKIETEVLTLCCTLASPELPQPISPDYNFSISRIIYLATMHENELDQQGQRDWHVMNMTILDKIKAESRRLLKQQR